MLLKEIQCIKEKANILFLQTLTYDKSEISKKIDILKKLIKHLNPNNYVFKNKIVKVKGD